MSLPCFYMDAKAENIINSQNNNQMELIQNNVQINDLDIEPINVNEVKKTVVPDTKEEGKKVINLFLRAMAGVVICAVILYFVLLFVKKYYGSAFVNTDYDEDFESLDLATPNNKQDALKSFLNRTR